MEQTIKVTLEQYLAGLTGEQMRALALKLWSDAGGKKAGATTLERYRAGKLRAKFEDTDTFALYMSGHWHARDPQEFRPPNPITPSPQRPPLVGVFVATVRFRSTFSGFNVMNCKSGDEDYLRMDFVRFDRDWSDEEVRDWALANDMGAAKVVQYSNTHTNNVEPIMWYKKSSRPRSWCYLVGFDSR